MTVTPIHVATPARHLLQVEIWKPDMSDKYDSIEDEIEGLTYSHLDGVGFATCTFTVQRNPKYFYDDLKPTNVIIIRYGPKIVWEGEIINPERSVQDDMAIQVEADGFAYRLGTRLAVHPTTGNPATFAANQRGSTWFANWLLADSDLDWQRGRVDTNDFLFPLAVDLSPESYYGDVIEKVNACNGWRVYLSAGKTFNFHPYATEPEYIVDIADGESSLAYSLEGIETDIHYGYSQDGTTNKYGWVRDATAKGLYRRRDGTLTVEGKADAIQAAQVANIAIGERKKMKPQSGITVHRIYDARTGLELPVFTAESGRILFIENLFEIDVVLDQRQQVNDWSTFNTAEATVDVDNETLTLSPGALPSRLAKTLARIDARTKQ